MNVSYHTRRIYQLFYKVFYKASGYGMFSRWLNFNVNRYVKNQLRDPFSIPILIISFNRLEYLIILIDFLSNRGFKKIVIFDNASTYEPLLLYYEELKANPSVKIERLEMNYGHLVLFKRKDLLRKYCRGFYVLTDADCIPTENMPNDFIEMMIRLLRKYYLDITKVGLALRLTDIPDHYIGKDKVLNWEKQFWEHEIENNIFKAKVDTTFALYKPKFGFNLLSTPFLSAIRVAGDYEIKHGGWYDDILNPSEELKNYYKTSNSSNTWKFDNFGEIQGDFKGLY